MRTPDVEAQVKSMAKTTHGNVDSFMVAASYCASCPVIKASHSSMDNITW